MSLSSQQVRRIARDLTKLQRSPPEGIGIEVGEQDILDLRGWIQGPAGTPYYGGYFMIKFDFLGVDFPTNPPKCLMKTKIFHPNIHSSGEICVSTLKKDWSSKYGIEHILLVIKCLLITPNPDSALDAEAGRLLQDAYSEYASTASVWTRIHANHCPPCFTLSEASSLSVISTQGKQSLEMGEGPSTTRPLTQSDSMNQNLSHKLSFGTFAADSSSSLPLVTNSTSNESLLQKRKSDQSVQVLPNNTKKRQSAVKRGIKRL